MDAKRYTYDDANVPVTYHVHCNDGRRFDEKGVIKIKGTTYSSFHADILSRKLLPEKCGYQSSICLRNIKTNTAITNLKGLYDQFDFCFPKTTTTTSATPTQTPPSPPGELLH